LAGWRTAPACTGPRKTPSESGSIRHPTPNLCKDEVKVENTLKTRATTVDPNMVKDMVKVEQNFLNAKKAEGKPPILHAKKAEGKPPILHARKAAEEPPDPQVKTNNNVDTCADKNEMRSNKATRALQHLEEESDAALVGPNRRADKFNASKMRIVNKRAHLHPHHLFCNNATGLKNDLPYVKEEKIAFVFSANVLAI
jgi:hypothetical protein